MPNRVWGKGGKDDRFQTRLVLVRQYLRRLGDNYLNNRTTCLAAGFVVHPRLSTFQITWLENWSARVRLWRRFVVCGVLQCNFNGKRNFQQAKETHSLAQNVSRLRRFSHHLPLAEDVFLECRAYCTMHTAHVDLLTKLRLFN